MTDEEYRQLIETEIEFTDFNMFIINQDARYSKYKKWTSWLIMMGLAETWTIV